MKPVSCLLALLSVTFSQLSFAATDLYFSEYVEGSSFNKALEIYNNTGASVDLGTYQIRFYYNGNSVSTRTIDLSGTLADGDVYVIADSQAGSEILAIANQTGGSSWYNGDDAVELIHNGTPIDVIGQIGVDPGSAWGTAPTSTVNTTLRRKAGVTDGDPNGFDTFDPALEWDVFAQDSFDDLGRYTPDDGGPISHCGEPAQPVHAIQGDGDVSPFLNQTVSIEAVVTADVQAGLRGFFIQQADDEVDADPQTSEGLFVFNGGGATIAIGDRVRVTGRVAEYFGLTELSNVTSVEVCASGLGVTPAVVELPFASTAAAEAYEGMAVVFPQNLSVTENYNLGRYDEVILSNGRLYQSTHVATPGAAAQAIMAANALNQITLDDGSSQQNPDPIIFPAPALSAGNTLRAGDSVANLTGVMSYGFNTYRIYPTQTPDFVASNARPVTLELPADRSVRIASFNVLNYFTTLDTGAPTCGPAGNMDCRGANSASEFERQQAKIVSALSGMQADVIGVMELENNGFGPDSAIANLVNALNLQAAPGIQYAYVDPGVAHIGTDAITVGVIYNINKVQIAGTPAILDSSVDSRFIDTRNRPTLAVSFTDEQSGQQFTVAVNHLKSKGSSCDDIGDPDTGDGQGNCNLTRTSAATALVDWLATAPTGINDPDILIIGDMNAYAKEDPITVITAGGYTDLIETELGDTAYSYVFEGQAGYLDHALASEEAGEQVTAVNEWHINADEPNVLNYNEEFKSAGQVVSLYAVDPFRASDHDPVIIDMQLLARCDLDKDGAVNLWDRLAFLRAFRSETGDANYLRRADMDRDGDVDVRDLTQFNRCVIQSRARGPDWYF